MTIIKNIISDFDNVAYAHTQQCFKRQHHAGILVAMAYFDLSYDEAFAKVKESWDEHKNGFYFALEDHPNVMRHVDFCELYRQQAALSLDAKNGIKCDETIRLINDISAKHPFIFASHSSYNSVFHMGDLIGLRKALIARGTYGMDTLGDKGGQRKDDVHSGIYPWLCEQQGFNPKETVMIEDSHANLEGAKLAGLQTIHIHWGKPVEQDYIDHSFKTTKQALLYLKQQLG